MSMAAQVIPQNRMVDWHNAGNHFDFSSITDTVDVTSFGAVGDGVTDDYNAISSAISSLNGKPGVVYFPAGTYLINNSIILPDSTVLAGSGADFTLLKFNSGENNHCITVSGTASTSIQSVQGGHFKNSTQLSLDTMVFAAGDLVEISQTGTQHMTSSWAYDCLGQIIKIDSVNGNDIFLASPLRMDYQDALQPRIRKINAKNAIGIHCLKIERTDSTGSQTSNIFFNYAYNCEIFGVESYKCNFSHFEINKSTNISVRNSYLQHAFSYGDGGKAYGVCVHATSGECLTENNIFEHLRHSMLLQSGANGNVFAYNYSKEPYWTDVTLPANSAGDMVLHGNYPYANLFEGNICQHIVIDDSHGKNGPFNTYLRNRAELYGIFMNNAPATDSVNIVGNEVTNTTFLMGLYFLQGVGHFQYGNNIKGTITPGGTSALNDTSYYYTSLPHFWNSNANYPPVGPPVIYNTYLNPAKERYLSGTELATCTDTSFITLTKQNFKENTNTFEIISYSMSKEKNSLDISLNVKSINKIKIIVYNTLGIVFQSIEVTPSLGSNHLLIPLDSKTGNAMVFVSFIQEVNIKTLKFVGL